MIIIGTIASSGGASRVALSVTYASNTVNASLALGGIAGYVSGKSDITITINSGIYLWSNSTTTPGFSMTGGASGDTVNIVNNGFIMGKGATGGTSTNGGVAISLSLNTTINNTNAAAYIGGGGAGGRTFITANETAGGGGGGAGGGCGGRGGSTTPYFPLVSGGAVGAIGSTAADGVPSGGGGGRIFPGTGGIGGNTTTGATAGRGGGAGGGGGTGTFNCSCGAQFFAGAAGGAGSAVGATAGAGTIPGGSGGGGWGAAGGLISGRTIAGGAGGNAVALNAKTVTWVSGNTTRVYGTVS